MKFSLFKKLFDWVRKKYFPSGSKADVRSIVDSEELYLEHPTNYEGWIPFAENIYETEGIKMQTRGEYTKGYPEGMVLHCTAGWQLKRGHQPVFFPNRPSIDERQKIEVMARDYALRVAREAVEHGYCFLIMDVLGNLYQSRPITKHGYHAGKSFLHGVGFNVSNKLMGLEMLNPGKLLVDENGKYWTWYGLEVPEKNVRIITTTTTNAEPGPYCMLTWEQEDMLKKVAIHMEENSPFLKCKKVFKYKRVVGHDEVSPGRKSDPGGALSQSMEGFRLMLERK